MIVKIWNEKGGNVGGGQGSKRCSKPKRGGRFQGLAKGRLVWRGMDGVGADDEVFGEMDGVCTECRHCATIYEL